MKANRNPIKFYNKNKDNKKHILELSDLISDEFKLYMRERHILNFIKYFYQKRGFITESQFQFIKSIKQL